MSNLRRVEIAEQLKFWFPIDAVIDDGRPAIEWMDLRDVDFNEPFFDETVARAARERVITDLDVLLQLEKISDSLKPSAFIFHCSRCGSTLMANAFRALQGSIVMAEAPVLDKIASRFITDEPTNSTKELLYMLLLRSAVAALGQSRSGAEQHYIVKFGCTTTLQIKRIRRIWPDVPFVFLYRNPVEVIVSNLSSKPQWMEFHSNPAAAAAMVGVEVAALERLTAAEFCARWIGRFMNEANASDDERSRFVDYEELSSDKLIDTIRFCGIEPSPEEIDAIRGISRLYSKDPSRRRTFNTDNESKKAAASAYVLEVAEKWAAPVYEKLKIKTEKRFQKERSVNGVIKTRAL